jgi:hypothetical protein
MMDDMLWLNMVIGMFPHIYSLNPPPSLLFKSNDVTTPMRHHVSKFRLMKDYVLTSPRRSQPRAIEYYEEPRRSTTRARSVSRRRVSDVEIRPGRSSYVDPRGSGYVNEHVTRRSVSRVRH